MTLNGNMDTEFGHSTWGAHEASGPEVHGSRSCAYMMEMTLVYANMATSKKIWSNIDVP
jgi:hypothetical protein